MATDLQWRFLAVKRQTWRFSRILPLIAIAGVIIWTSTNSCESFIPSSIAPNSTHLMFPRNSKEAMALLVPFTLHEGDEVARTLAGWLSRHPCNSCDLNYDIDLVLYFNRDWKEIQDTIRNTITSEVDAVMSGSKCFRGVRWLSANLTDLEDIYPAGPSNQFYKLFGSLFENLSAQYRCFMWMELDVFMIRESWMDALARECFQDWRDWWMKGSITKGNVKLDDSTANWLPHINGNALYRLGKPHFRRLIHQVEVEYPPNVGWHPFDVAIYQLTHRRDQYQHYVQYASKLVYSDFVLNWYNNLTQERLLAISNEEKGTFIVHGHRPDRPPKRSPLKEAENCQISELSVSGVSLVTLVDKSAIASIDMSLQDLMKFDGFREIVLVDCTGDSSFAETLKTFEWSRNTKVRAIIPRGTTDLSQGECRELGGLFSISHKVMFVPLDTKKLPLGWETLPEPTLPLDPDAISVLTRALLFRSMGYRVPSLLQQGKRGIQQSNVDSFRVFSRASLINWTSLNSKKHSKQWKHCIVEL